ncbi:MAG: DUF2971 domain-containing protein [Alcanivoracaceae bacterium]|nr:DUF2971 domain-containing protein [Alcanivoracaceae bacterium]
MSESEALARIMNASQKTLEMYRADEEIVKKQMFDITMRTTNKNVGVFSLTETNNNELMWAHYADSHRGYAVAFDTETDFFFRRENDPKICGEMANVIYSDTPPTVYLDPGKMNIPKELFFTKTTQWSYEKEWRMIRMLEHADSVVEEKIHLFKIEPESVISIIFGSKFPEKEKAEIMESFKKIVPHADFMNASMNHEGKFVVS